MVGAVQYRADRAQGVGSLHHLAGGK
jgi:hypothetical protein